MKDRRCGTCEKFKGPTQACGQTYEQMGAQHAYMPVNEDVGPCQNGYVAKKEPVVVTSLDQLLKDTVETRTCGDCLFLIGGNCDRQGSDSYGMDVYETTDASSCKLFLRNIPGVMCCGNCSNNVNNACTLHASDLIPVQFHHGTRCKSFNRKKEHSVSIPNEEHSIMKQRDSLSFARKVTILDLEANGFSTYATSHHKEIPGAFKLHDFGYRGVTGHQQFKASELKQQSGVVILDDADKCQFKPKKETNNMSNAIIRLADSQLSKEVEDFGGLQVDLRDALTKLQAEERQTAAANAAREVMSLINDANEHIEYQVREIRSCRNFVENAKKDISAINKARAYGLKTNNFVPLAVHLGKILPNQVEDKSLLEIDESKLPEDWDKKPS
jgi:hypothetical protein